MDPPQRSKPKSTPPGQAAGSVKSGPKDDSIPSGRVRHDERGNAVVGLVSLIRAEMPSKPHRGC